MEGITGSGAGTVPPRLGWQAGAEHGNWNYGLSLEVHISELDEKTVCVVL